MKTVLCLSLCVQHAMLLAVLDLAASRQKLENEYLSVAAAFTPWKAVCTFSAVRVRAAMPVEGSKCQNTQEALDVGSKRVCLPDFNTADVYKDVEKYM